MIDTSSTTTCRTWQPVAWESACHGLDLDRAGHTTTAVGTSLYIFGGRKGSTFHNDVLCFDTRVQTFVTPMPKCPFSARAHHTATLIGHRIWFVGGSDRKNIFNTVFFLDLSEYTWKEVIVSDPHGLLMRCAHAADIHPSKPNTIVIMGGFGAPVSGMNQDYHTLNDVLLLHTDSCTVERLQVPDPLPTSRAHHSMNFIGHLALIFGGRVTQDLVPDDDPSMFCYLDLQQCRWVYPQLEGSIVGDRPTTRSSHKTVVYNGRLLLHGGAINQEGQGDRKERLGDMYTLIVNQAGKHLCWSTIDRPEPAATMPKARSAHEMCTVGDTLYIMLGYAGSEQGQRRDMYARDCWKLQLVPKHVKSKQTHSTVSAAAVAAVNKAVVAPGSAADPSAAVSGGRHLTDKTRVSGARARSKSPLGGGASGAANNAAAGAAAAPSGVWRTAKRQRSGGLSVQQQPQQPLVTQQKRNDAEAGPSAEAQPHRLQHLPQLPEQQPVQQVQQQVQQHSPGRQPFSGLDAAAAAAAATAGAAVSWAVHQGHFVPMGERCCPASPGYSGQLEYLRQQEYDHLREQLQRQCSRMSSLEGENKQLIQQLQELKQEKQQTDQLMQQLQGDCMRHKLSAEQATLRRQHEQEEAQLLRQQLEACKQQSRKAQAEAEQLRLQAQNLNHDITQLQAQFSKAGKDKDQLQEQLLQQQEHQRSAEEKHAQERQAYQQTYNNLAASIEDYRNQLSRLNEVIADDKRKHEVEASKFRAEAASKDLQLQERVRELLDVQQQLHNMRTALADEQQKAERFQQLHCTTAKEVQDLQQKLTALAGDRTRLEAELSQLQDQYDRIKVELDKKITSIAAVRAAMLQWQGLQQNIMHALG